MGFASVVVLGGDPVAEPVELGIVFGHSAGMLEAVGLLGLNSRRHLHSCQLYLLWSSK